MTALFKERISRVLLFFPFQLLWVQFKKNQTVLLFWLILFAYVTGNLAYNYGIPHLLLYPEYLGEVNFLSHAILGFSCGVFIMAYNISTYIINGRRFPFIATLSRPFLKFCYNNSLIPWIFTIVYIFNLYKYQSGIELESNMKIFMHILGFLFGNFAFIAISTLYFISTNKNIFSFPRKRKKEKSGQSAMHDFIHRPTRWDKVLDRKSTWRIETYFSHPFKISLARSSEHYKKETIYKVLSQNHINASFFEIACILAIATIGFFKDYEIFLIPASASLLLMFSIILMLASALHSWVKGWSFTIFILIFFGLHFATVKDWINFENKAYGLQYEGIKANYSEEFLLELARDKYSNLEDHENGLRILENWKESLNLPESVKPKMVIINASGGGLRSMLWTTLGILHLDNELEGNLMNHTHLITGSSGGMIGAAYVRELYLNSLQPEDFRKEMDSISAGISRDILNAVALNLVTNDIFPKYQKFYDGDYKYPKDRAYAFEQTLNENVGGLFNKRLQDYQQDEFEARTPLMIFAPTIINDARRLIISAQPVSYMTDNLPTSNLESTPLLEYIEYQKFFNDQDAANIRFTSVLRMTATFPYILPAVSLPSKPQIKIMDSGIRDNYGLTSSLKYLYSFRDWINENTSGVVILQMRDKFKRYEAKRRNSESLLRSLTSPLDNFYNNWTNVQTFEQDQLLQYASAWFDGKLEVIPFQLKNDPTQKISLSWHLTNIEKKRIMESLDLKENKEILNHLKSILIEENNAIAELIED